MADGKAKLNHLQKGEIAWTGISSYMAQYLQNKITASQSRIASSQYRSQANLTMLAAQQQSLYDNEALAQQVWNEYAASRELSGQQRALMAVSGFDVSTGDQRILSDTIRKTDDVVAGLNRTAQINTFEQNRAAIMEANRLEYSARMQDVVAKYTSGWRGQLSSISAGLNSAMGSYFQNWKESQISAAKNSLNNRVVSNV